MFLVLVIQQQARYCKCSEDSGVAENRSSRLVWSSSYNNHFSMSYIAEDVHLQ